MKKGLILFIFSLLYFLSTEAQTWNWAKEETMCGDPNGFYSYASSDDSGNIYYAVPSSLTLCSLSKFDNKGTLIWQQNAGNTLSRPVQMTAYRLNNIFWAGNFETKFLVFGADTLFPGSSGDIFLGKYNSAGTLQWIKQSRGLHYSGAIAYSVAADGTGNSYVTGVFSDTINFDTDTLRTLSSATFLVKYDVNGNVLWAKSDTTVSRNYFAYPLSVSADNFGNSFIGGYYIGSVIFGKDTLPLTALTETNSFLVKYDPNGNVLWAWTPKLVIGWGINHIESISSDWSGNIFISGTFKNGTMNIGTSTFGRATRSTPFLAKFNSSGSVSWAQQVYELDNNAWGVISVAVDTMGNGCLCLKDSGINPTLSIKLAADTLRYTVGAFMMDAIFQFDSAGNSNCGGMFGEEGEDDGDGMCVSPSGQYIYAVGDIEYVSDVIFGTTDTLKNGSSIYEYSFIGSWQPCTNNETSVNSISINDVVRVFPNPNNGVFTIQTPIINSKLSLEVFNILGEKVLTGTFLPTQNGNIFDLRGQSNGIYLYRIVSDSCYLVSEGKLILQK